jgi:hypothetical protein
MSQPFSGLPDPGNPSPFRRRSQSGVAQEALQAALQGAQAGLRTALRGAEGVLREARRQGDNLWLRMKRKPRTFGLIGAGIAVTLVGAYALSASGAGRSMCPPMGKTSSSSRVDKGRKTPSFLLLMDEVAHPAAGSELEINYDVCGLAEGTPYSGRVVLSQRRPGGKKKSPKPKALVVTFKDKADGVASRRSRELDLGTLKPGAYTLELSVVDNQGRERKRLQKIRVKAP